MTRRSVELTFNKQSARQDKTKNWLLM